MSDPKAQTTKAPNKDKKSEDRPKKNDQPKDDKRSNEKTEKHHEEKKTGDHKGEHKGEHKGYRSKPIYKEKLNVDINTVIPDMPKDRLHAPNEDDHDKELDKIAKDIDELYKKMNDVAREAYKKENENANDKGYFDLVDLLKIKQDEKKKCYDALQGANAERDQYKKQLEEYYEKSNEYRFKMKVAGKKEDLEAQLKVLKLKQSSGTIGLQEEKQIIREIGDLERSIPFAGPLQDLEDQFKDVKDNLKKAKKESGDKLDVFKRLKEECRDIQEQIDKANEDYQKQKKESTPAIQKMKDEYRDQIDKLKEKRKAVNKKYKDLWDRYEEQQAEIDRIKKMQKIKAGILRAEERKKKHEEWEKRQKERDEERREVPYLSEIELCNQLIQYCTKLQPSKEEVVQVQTKTKEEIYAEVIKTDQWKGQKFEVVKSKKERDEEPIGKKKHQKKQQAPKEEAKNEAQPLNHQFDAINYFDTLKVTPPLFTDRLADTIKLLTEKRDYFQKLQNEAVKAEDEKKNKPEGEEKPAEEGENKPVETTTQEKQKESPKKKKNAGQKPEAVDTNNEKDFPSFSATK